MSATEPLPSLEKIRVSDEGAVVALFKYLLPHLQGYVRRSSSGLDISETEDIAQEAAISVLRRLPRLLDSLSDETSDEEFRGRVTYWAMSAARNQILRLQRDRHVAVSKTVEDPDLYRPAPAKDLHLQLEVRDIMQRVMSMLSERDRSILMLVFEGRSQVEIARTLGISRASLYKRLRVIREELQKLDIQYGTTER